MVIYVDIDETICDSPPLIDGKRDYTKAVPYNDRIERVNKLYDEGNTIIYWTARGTKLGGQWFHLTYNQLTQWGVKFHELRLGKPYYDMFIDDKNINSEAFFNRD